MRISDWSSDVCSSDLGGRRYLLMAAPGAARDTGGGLRGGGDAAVRIGVRGAHDRAERIASRVPEEGGQRPADSACDLEGAGSVANAACVDHGVFGAGEGGRNRSANP